MSMNTKQARVVDPILTTIAQGYSNPSRVGKVLFPPVDVAVRGGTILQFGKEAFRAMNARRAPGSDTKSVEFGYAGKPFQLVQDALNAPVPREIMEDAMSVPGIDLGTRATERVMGILTLGLEIEQAELATNPANYPAANVIALSGATKWSDSTSDPYFVVQEAKEQVRRSAGVEPNRMVVSKPGFNALKRHPKVKDQFKYTSADSITEKMLAAFLELETLAVGTAGVLPGGADDDAPFEDVWGNNAILAYVPEKPSGMELPSFGYTYTLKGHPFVEKPEWENGIKSWVYGVTYERVPVIAGMASGALIRSIV